MQVRSIQTKYTYKRECLLKYGDDHGQRIFELTNHIFDFMPLSAVVNNCVFACHGGIPHEVTTILQINDSIPEELVAPDTDCTVAWEIMWSDPLLHEQFQETCALVERELAAKVSHKLCTSALDLMIVSTFISLPTAATGVCLQL